MFNEQNEREIKTFEELESYMKTSYRYQKGRPFDLIPVADKLIEFGMADRLVQYCRINANTAADHGEELGLMNFLIGKGFKKEAREILVKYIDDMKSLNNQWQKNHLSTAEENLYLLDHEDARKKEEKTINIFGDI